MDALVALSADVPEIRIPKYRVVATPKVITKGVSYLLKAFLGSTALWQYSLTGRGRNGEKIPLDEALVAAMTSEFVCLLVFEIF